MSAPLIDPPRYHHLGYGLSDEGQLIQLWRHNSENKWSASVVADLSASFYGNLASSQGGIAGDPWNAGQIWVLSDVYGSSLAPKQTASIFHLGNPGWAESVSTWPGTHGGMGSSCPDGHQSAVTTYGWNNDGYKVDVHNLQYSPNANPNGEVWQFDFYSTRDFAGDSVGRMWNVTWGLFFGHFLVSSNGDGIFLPYELMEATPSGLMVPGYGPGANGSAFIISLYDPSAFTDKLLEVVDEQTTSLTYEQWGTQTLGQAPQLVDLASNPGFCHSNLR